MNLAGKTIVATGVSSGLGAETAKMLKAAGARVIGMDLKISAENVDLVFTPTPAIMYPTGFQTDVIVNDVSKMLEGASRPTHFKGVTTVVTKLFNIIQPTRAYFGQKDFQQTVVLKRMVSDLNINTELVICPIIREPDGLAMSSRNSYLNPDERAAALVVSRAWKSALGALQNGETNGDVIRQTMRNVIAQEPLARLDYVSFAHPETLEELDAPIDGAILSLAAFLGKTRLIDNHIWQPDSISSL